MEEKQENKSMFETLKGFRIKKELSLQNLSEISRIQIKYLEALEEGELLKIPEVYDKLFFKSYLKVLGINEEDYYDEFIVYRNNIRSDKTTTVYDFEKKIDNVDKFLNYKNLILILPVLVVILVLWILITNTEIVESSSKDEVKEIDINNIVKEIREREKAMLDSLQEETKDIEESENIVESKNIAIGLDLNILGKEKTWFRVISDKKDTSEYMLNRGRTLTIKADECFEFLIGRADGLQLELNGNMIGPLGNSREIIRYMLIDKSGIVAKRVVTPVTQ